MNYCWVSNLKNNYISRSKKLSQILNPMKTKLLLLPFLILFSFQELHAQNIWKGYVSYGIGVQPRNSAFSSDVIPLQAQTVVGDNKEDHGPALHNFTLGVIKKHSEKINFRFGLNYQNVFSWNGISTNGSKSAGYIGDSLVRPGEERSTNYGYQVLGFEFAVERNLLTKNKAYNFWVLGGLEVAYLQRFDSYEVFEIETQRIRDSFTATYDDVLLRGLVGISGEKVVSKKLSLRLDFMVNPLYYFSPYKLKITNYKQDYQGLNDREYIYSVNARESLGELDKERIILSTYRLNFSLVFNL